ncbi:MAG: patatin-like phospholipase family protein [Spirochaetales bacterium]|nr:patatin-like phospholipase family protein [Spirochaetales bacterium]
MKKYIILLIIPFMTLFPVSAETAPQDKPVVAVVLAGGGALGYAHVGALQVLEEEGIRPDIVLGTSMGSIIGGLYCAGYSPWEMEEIVGSTDWKRVFWDSYDRRDMSFLQKQSSANNHFVLGISEEQRLIDAGVSHAQHVMEFLDELLITYNREMDFDDLPIPFRAIGADLLTGEKIVYGEGDLKSTIRGSMAVPGVFTPIEYKGRYVIDGGWVDNLPSTVARELGADIVISVSLYGLIDELENLQTMSAVNYQAGQIRTIERSTASREASDLIIAPELTGYTTADFEKGPELMAKGYEAADSIREEIAQLSEIINCPPIEDYNYVRIDREIPISAVRNMDGTHTNLTRAIEEDLEELYDGHPTGEELQDYLYAYYDGSDYSHFWYHLVDDQLGGYFLEIDGPERVLSDVYVGMSMELSTYMTQPEITDLSLQINAGTFLGEKQKYVLYGDLSLSQFPGVTLGLGQMSPRQHLIINEELHLKIDPKYYYEEDSIESIYALYQFGGIFSFKVPVFSVFSLTNGIYFDMNMPSHYLGTRTMEEDNWTKYGYNINLAFENLDRIVVPQSGFNGYYEFNNALSDEEMIGTSRSAGELFVPIMDKNVIGQLGYELSITHWGDPNTYETAWVGEKIGMIGFYEQELTDLNFLMLQLGFNIKIGMLPLGMGEEIYFQFGSSTAALASDALIEKSDEVDLYESAYAGLKMRTILGEFQFNGSYNSEERFSLFLGLKTTAALH